MPRNFLRVLKRGIYVAASASASLLDVVNSCWWKDSSSCERLKWRRNGSQIFSSTQEIWESNSSLKDPSIKSCHPPKCTGKKKTQQSLRIGSSLQLQQTQLNSSAFQLSTSTRFGRFGGTDLNLFSLLLQRLHRSIWAAGVDEVTSWRLQKVDVQQEVCNEKKGIHSPSVTRKESGFSMVFLALPTHF